VLRIWDLTQPLLSVACRRFWTATLGCLCTCSYCFHCWHCTGLIVGASKASGIAGTMAQAAGYVRIAELVGSKGKWTPSDVFTKMIVGQHRSYELLVLKWILCLLVQIKQQCCGMASWCAGTIKWEWESSSVRQVVMRSAIGTAELLTFKVERKVYRTIFMQGGWIA
jgi:hypothetical protein